MISFNQYLDELTKPKELDKFRKSVKGFNKVDTRKSGWKITLDDMFSNYGFKRLGAGKYASVYGHPKYPYVVKVFQKDAAFLRWVKFAQENRKNPYVPKIRGRVTKINKMFFVLRMEKLTPYDWGSKLWTHKFMRDYDDWTHDKGTKSDDKNIQDILDCFAKNEKLLDIHGENVMLRGKQLVIIDPFYNWFGKKAPGEYSIDPDEIDPSVF